MGLAQLAQHSVMAAQPAPQVAVPPALLAFSFLGQFVSLLALQQPIIMEPIVSVGTFLGDSLKIILACTTLDSSCKSCSNSNTCSACNSNKFPYGATCQTSCPSTTYKNSSGFCIGQFLFYFEELK